MNDGLSVLDQARALHPCHRPEKNWPPGTRMVRPEVAILGADQTERGLAGREQIKLAVLRRRRHDFVTLRRSFRKVLLLCQTMLTSGRYCVSWLTEDSGRDAQKCMRTAMEPIRKPRARHYQWYLVYIQKLLIWRQMSSLEVSAWPDSEFTGRFLWTWMATIPIN